jgi:hypothetical protein
MWIEDTGTIQTPYPIGKNMIEELQDFDASLASADYDFEQTVSGKLHRETQEAFASIFSVPNEWLKPEYVDHRSSAEWTPVRLVDGRIVVDKS